MLGGSHALRGSRALGGSRARAGGLNGKITTSKTRPVLHETAQAAEHHRAISSKKYDFGAANPLHFRARARDQHGARSWSQRPRAGGGTAAGHPRARAPGRREAVYDAQPPSQVGGMARPPLAYELPTNFRLTTRPYAHTCLRDDLTQKNSPSPQMALCKTRQPVRRSAIAPFPVRNAISALRTPQKIARERASSTAPARGHGGRARRHGGGRAAPGRRVAG